MKRAFVNTDFFKRALASIEGLQERGSGTPGLGLWYGNPGLGKTSIMARIVALKPECAAVRAVAGMSQRWLLEAIVAELGVKPDRRTQDLFHQAGEHLFEERRTVIIDEVDYLTHDSIVLNTIRDLHDITGTPFVLVGMGEVDKKLRRQPHFFARISQVIKFDVLTEKDVDTAARDLCELPLDAAAVHALKERTRGVFREVVVTLNQAERIAKMNKLTAIDEALINGLKVRPL